MVKLINPTLTRKSRRFEAGGYSLMCHVVYLATSDLWGLSIIDKKTNCNCFSKMQQLKMKFMFVQINMKHVSYI